jgi:chorismate synthase
MRYLTAGESHGKCLTAIIEGFPANLRIDVDKINKRLSERQSGYGRGGRMKIETDKVEILAGVRNQKTIGSPICLMIENKDWINWKDIVPKEVTKPRPGHADLTGSIKYNQDDIRNILERASARETAIRVAVGALCEQLLEQLGIHIFSHVIQIGNSKANQKFNQTDFNEKIQNSQLRCLDMQAEEKMIAEIQNAKEHGDSIGGIFEIIGTGIPVGLGSHVHWDRKLDARIARAVMSIQAIKGVEFGIGFEYASTPGTKAHDEIFYHDSGYTRKTNYCGGIEGGMTNGEDILLKAVMKPIPTVMSPLNTIDIKTKESCLAITERSDVCAVPAASVVGQSAVAWEIAQAAMEKFGGDSIEELMRSFGGEKT